MAKLRLSPIYKLHPYGLGVVKSWLRIGDTIPDGWSRERPIVPEPVQYPDITEPRSYRGGDSF